MSSPQHHPRVESFLLFTSLEVKVSQKPGQLGTLTLITLMRKVSGLLQCALWSWLQCCGAAVPGEWGRAGRRRMRLLQHPEGSGPAAWWFLLQALSVCSRILLYVPVCFCAPLCTPAPGWAAGRDPGWMAMRGQELRAHGNQRTLLGHFSSAFMGPISQGLKWIGRQKTEVT